ncbi:transcriptional regulator [Rhodococcus sp. DSM 6344]|nr:transcriptional regulator [Rhodococcus erythropolis]
MSTRGLLTTDQVLDLIESETGTRMAESTFRSYVARGRAPKPDDHIGRTPLWKRAAIMKWLAERQGVPGRPRNRQ